MPQMRGPLPANDAELKVHRALQAQLPDDWWVLTNVNWSLPESSDSGSTTWVRDGQADFVVIAPNLGLIVIEVKGSRHVRVAEDGRWHRRSSESVPWTPLDKSPAEQATGNAHQLKAHLMRQRRMASFPYRFGYLVVYPHGTITAGSLSMFDSSTAVFKQQLQDLRNRIRVALQARGPDAAGRELTHEVARDMANILSNANLVIAPTDSAAEARADVHAIEQLTRQQFAALQGIFRNPRVAVTGPAGSGKTVLAMWRLAAAIEEGWSAKYLCYNKSLAEYLRLRNPELADHIDSVDAYFMKLTGSKRLSPSGDVNKHFAEDLPGSVIDVVSQWSDDEKFDALLVDEGQDFNEFRLMAVRDLIKPDGTYLYCSDDRQDLYSRKARAAVGAEITFSLVHNCRNTVSITETANRALEEHVAPMPGLPAGQEPTVRVCADRGTMAKTAWELAGTWAADGGRVAMLSPYKLENSSLSEKRSAHGKSLVTELSEWSKSDAVFFSTIKSFKGIEADAVIVVDVDEVGRTNALDRGDLYVACTRGRARLGVLCRSAAAAKQLAR